jgi:hypothetical protein
MKIDARDPQYLACSIACNPNILGERRTSSSFAKLRLETRDSANCASSGLRPPEHGPDTVGRQRDGAVMPEPTAVPLPTARSVVVVNNELGWCA